MIRRASLLLPVASCLLSAACGSDKASSAADTAPPDTNAPDSSTPDTADPDAANPDTDLPDTNAPDNEDPPDTTAADIEAPDSAQDTRPDVPWTPITYTYPTCGPTAADLAGCVDPARMESSLSAIVGSRYPGEAKWQEAQDLCRTTFEGLGFETTLQPTLLGVNVIGVKLGTELPNEQVILGAHYDGVRGCDGADDNGSGVAGVLEAARVLSEGAHRRTLVVACWDVEELGLEGSTTHASLITPEDVIAVYDFEMIGFTDDTPNSQQLPLGFGAFFPEAPVILESLGGRGVFIALIAGENASGPVAALSDAARAIGLPVAPIVLAQNLIGLSGFADLHRSDHASFWRRGIPAVQLTDTANFRNPNYHCPTGNTDTLATIDHDFLRAVVAMTTVATKVTLDATDPGVAHVPHVAECDVGAQDCGAGKRCTFAAESASGTARRTCVDLTANPAGPNEDCQRPDGIIGRDDCGAGLFCAFYGGVRTSDTEAAFQRVCSPLCTATADCGPGGFCVGISGSFFEPTGVCRPTCSDAFSDGCGAGQKCAPTTHLEGAFSSLTCLPSGPRAVGEACTGSPDCGVGAVCRTLSDGSGAVCRAHCDPSHPCGGGLTCEPLGLLDRDLALGVCVE